MKKYLTRSNTLAFTAILILFGYIGITYYKLHKEKPIYVIGMCAKDKSRLNSFHYLKNADDIKKELKKEGGLAMAYFKYFKECEDEYRISPRAMKLKYLED